MNELINVDINCLDFHSVKLRNLYYILSEKY